MIGSGLLNKILPGGAEASQILDHVRGLLAQKPKPASEMSPLQARVWLLVSDKLTEWEIGEPLRSVTLRLMESMGDDDLKKHMGSIVNLACDVQDILDVCN